MQGLPHIGARGFGKSQVKGLNRVPDPPAKIIAWILLKSIHIPLNRCVYFLLKVRYYSGLLFEAMADKRSFAIS